MSDISVDLVSQERKVWAGTARSVSAPSVDGQIGIWAGHQPLLAVLQPGRVNVIMSDGRQLGFRLSKTANSPTLAPGVTAGNSGDPQIDNSVGFLSVDGNLVTVVADVITQLS
jgi:F-type H+-transporting ATPase subunit epsilon